MEQNIHIVRLVNIQLLIHPKISQKFFLRPASSSQQFKQTLVKVAI